MKKMIEYAKRNNFITAFFLAFTILVATYIYQKLMAVDGWYIMNDGKEIIVNHNFYNYTSFVDSGYNKVVQQWLYSVILYLLYTYTGRIGVYIFVLLEVFALVYVLFQFAKINKANKTLSILTIFISLVFFNYLNNRPELITCILLILQLLGTEKYKTTGKIRYLVPLIVISVLESNLHSSMLIYHYLFMIAYIFPGFNFQTKRFKKIEYCVWKLCIALLLMVGVSFINPYTADAALYLIKVYPYVSQNYIIAEMQAVKFLSADGLLLIAGIAITLYLIKKQTISPEWFYLSAGTLLLASVSIRNVTAFVLIFCVLMFKWISTIQPDRINSLFNKIQNINQKSIYAICILLVFVPTLMFASSVTASTTESKDSYITPVKAIQWLQKHETRKPYKIRIFTSNNIGSFVEYNGYKIFMTSNSERPIQSINNKEDYFTNLKSINDLNSVEEFINKYNFDYFIYDNIGKYSLCFDIYFSQSDKYIELFKGNGYTFVQKKNCNVRYR